MDPVKNRNFLLSDELDNFIQYIELRWQAGI
jgi:hypothetical protein